MKTFFGGIGTIFWLELRQRLRGVAWYVLLGVFFAILLVVTIVTSVVVYGFARADQANVQDAAAQLFSYVVYFVLLLGTLVAPAMSGNAINGDRDAGTLATTQVTLVTTWQLILGKLLAAWVTALGFLLVSSPFLAYSAIAGLVSPLIVLASLLVLAVELGIVAAIGVGFSGLIPRPLFSVVVTYLAVAALSLGTLIAFGLGGAASQTSVIEYGYDNVHVKTQTCTGLEEYPTSVPRFDHVWGVLVANPYVLLADAVPTSYDKNGNPTDLFGQLKYGERSSQLNPVDQATPAQECKTELAANSNNYDGGPSARDTIDSTTPGWAVGLAIQLVLAAAAVVGAWARTRTPARKLPKGSRVA
ncbi:MAG TPA: ABC transporter permease subunit [Galbitalea sp.]